MGDYLSHPNLPDLLGDLSGRVAALERAHIIEDSNPLSALAFTGMDRTGVADSATALTTAAAAAAGRPLILPFGTYRLLSGLVMPTPADVTLILDDAELDISDLGAGGIGITAQGSLGTAVNVNAVAFGAIAITGAAGIETGIDDGDILKLYSADVFDPGRTNTTCAEQVKVLSTSPGQIDLRSPVMGAYSTTVKFQKVTRGKLTIKGTGRITGGGSGSGHYGVRAKWIDGLRIDGPRIEFRGCETKAIEIWDCLDFEIAHVDVEGSNNASNGYGVSVVNACQFGRVHHSHFRDCRHATSTNNGTLDGAGIPRHIGHDHNQVRDTLANAMDTHAAAEYITYEHNKIYDAGAFGINLECPKGKALFNEIHRPGDTAIFLLSCTSVAAEYEVRGNDMYDGPSYGVRYHTVAGTAGTPTQLDVIDNKGYRLQDACVHLNPSTAGHRLVGARVRDNRGYACCQSSGFACFYLVDADASQFLDNVAIEQPPTRIGSRLDSFTRGVWGGNITSFASAATVAAHFGVGVTDSVVFGQVARNATGVSSDGLQMDATSANNVIMANALRAATIPLNLGGVVSHISTTADAAGAYNKVA